MSYDEQPAWVWKDGVSWIVLPGRPIRTEWLITTREPVGSGALWRRRQFSTASPPDNIVRCVFVEWRPGMEWCAQERPAPERRSGKDRRNPTVTISSPIAAPEPVVTRTGCRDMLTPPEITWEKSDGWPVDAASREMMARQAFDLAKRGSTSFVRTGEALVLCYHREAAGTMEILDCTILRTARVRQRVST